MPSFADNFLGADFAFTSWNFSKGASIDFGTGSAVIRNAPANFDGLSIFLPAAGEGNAGGIDAIMYLAEPTLNGVMADPEVISSGVIVL